MVCRYWNHNNRNVLCSTECVHKKRASCTYCMRGFVKTITAITLVSTLSINRPSIALKGNKMLVKEYFELEIANRPYTSIVLASLSNQLLCWYLVYLAGTAWDHDCCYECKKKSWASHLNIQHVLTKATLLCCKLNFFSAHWASLEFWGCSGARCHTLFFILFNLVCFWSYRFWEASWTLFEFKWIFLLTVSTCSFKRFSRKRLFRKTNRSLI